MKKINYFDEISGKEIVVEVSDEVAAELQAMREKKIGQI